MSNNIDVRMGGKATLKARPQLLAYVTPPLVSAPARSTTEGASVTSAPQDIMTILTALVSQDLCVCLISNNLSLSQLVNVTALGLIGCLALTPVLATVKRILLVKSATNAPQQDSIILCVKSATATQTV